MPKIEVEFGDEVPESIKDVWTHFGGLTIPEGVTDKNLRKIYELGAQGKCMLCHRWVGSEATLRVNVLGITELYCSNVCWTDMYVRGWLTEQFDDLVEALKFRSTQPVN